MADNVPVPFRVPVWQKAPDFEAAAVLPGPEFAAKPVRLSDLKGKWVGLFFYPADFTYI